jgi:F0F1-type ATP synthase epsilon subunit
MENPTVPHRIITDPIAALSAMLIGSVVNLFAVIDPEAVNGWILLINTAIVTIGMTLLGIYAKAAETRRRIRKEDEEAAKESIQERLAQSEKERTELRERLEEAESNVSALLKITPRNGDKSQ